MLIILISRVVLSYVSFLSSSFVCVPTVTCVSGLSIFDCSFSKLSLAYIYHLIETHTRVRPSTSKGTLYRDLFVAPIVNNDDTKS